MLKTLFTFLCISSLSPASLFTITDTELEIKKISIHNLQGEIIFEYDVTKGSVINEIDLSNYSKGLYIVSIIDNQNAVGVHKIVVE